MRVRGRGYRGGRDLNGGISQLSSNFLAHDVVHDCPRRCLVHTKEVVGHLIGCSAIGHPRKENEATLIGLNARLQRCLRVPVRPSIYLAKNWSTHNIPLAIRAMSEGPLRRDVGVSGVDLHLQESFKASSFHPTLLIHHERWLKSLLRLMTEKSSHPGNPKHPLWPHTDVRLIAPVVLAFFAACASVASMT